MTDLLTVDAIRDVVPGLVVLTVSGELDLATAAVLRAELDVGIHDPRPDHHAERVIVDLARVRFMDCAGLDAVVDAQLSADQEGVVLALADLQPEPERLLALTGMDRRILVYADTAKAVQGLRAP